MAPRFETGMFVHEPSWHRLENVVLDDWPGTWELALKHAKIDWEVESEPVFARNPGMTIPTEIPGWRALRRNDSGVVLACQPTSYKLITIAELGEVIEQVLGIESGEAVLYEGVMSLYDGKQIVVVTYFPEPLQIGVDPSKTFAYICFSLRFDGNGGLVGLPTTIRVVCANTQKAAEWEAGRNQVGFTIRHTSNWESRIADVKDTIQGARRDAKAWETLANKLGAWQLGRNDTGRFLGHFLPLSSDMSKMEVNNVNRNRETIRNILQTKTCEGIAGTGYGLVMAATEWSDHFRAHRSKDSYVARQLLRKEPTKTKAIAVVKSMAGVKG